MPDFKDLVRALNQIYGMIFGNQIPTWLPRLTGILLLLGICFFAVWGLLLLLSKILTLWKEQLRPLFYNEGQKRFTQRRRRFAEHVEYEIRRINRLEEWSDYRFAELEAEVEAEGRWRTGRLFAFWENIRDGIRKERSLSKALERSKERLILLEGDPGAGKSVALRHLTAELSHRAARSRSGSSLIPIYINLKELERQPAQSVDRQLIHEFVIKFLNRANDRDIEDFLDEEFDAGLQAGSWLFLFDSFDEIPELLSSTTADRSTLTYAEAISDFLHGMNTCRGIVASRAFKGPGQSGWPKFRILSLSERRKLELISRAELGRRRTTQFLGELESSQDEIRSMAGSPMFLGLLCEHCRQGLPFPQNTHSVFESYMTSRLGRDSARLSRRFGLTPQQVRKSAESVAFCMAADDRLGLSPTRTQIKHALLRQGLDADIELSLNALEYLKLARSETAGVTREDQAFTFSHRRFQEYFATCVVLQEPQRVSPQELLADAKWRETAVTLCQTQPAAKLTPLLGEAERMLIQASIALDLASLYSRTEGVGRQPFPWPANLLYTLELLDEGFMGRSSNLPETIQTAAAQIIVCASKTGTLFDRRVSIEVAGIAGEKILYELLESAMKESSIWLKGVAFEVVGKLKQVPPIVITEIQRSLFMSVAQVGGRDRPTMYAYLSRLEPSKRLIRTYDLLYYGPLAFMALLVIPLAQASLLLGAAQPWMGISLFGTGAVVMSFSWLVQHLPKANRQIGVGPFIAACFLAWYICAMPALLGLVLHYLATFQPLTIAGHLITLTQFSALQTELASFPIPALWRLIILSTFPVVLYASLLALNWLGANLGNPVLWILAPVYLLLVIPMKGAAAFKNEVGGADWSEVSGQLQNLTPWLRFVIIVLGVLIGGAALILGVGIAILVMIAVAGYAFFVVPGQFLALITLEAKEDLAAEAWIASQDLATLCLQDVINELDRYNLAKPCRRIISAVRTGGLLRNIADEKQALNVLISRLESVAKGRKELSDLLPNLQLGRQALRALRTPRVNTSKAVEWPEHLPDIFFQNRSDVQSVIDELGVLMNLAMHSA